MNKNFGEFGGMYVPEVLMNALLDLESAFSEAIADPGFIQEQDYYLKYYVGRESPLYLAENLTSSCGGAKIFLKREDLNHTGAHKINNVVGQLLLARRMGKRNVIAETGAGQHGVATATGAALFGMDCTVYMGQEDMERQKLNVFKMELLGAKVIPVTSGTGTLKDATNEAIRSWVANVKDTFYVIGSVVGPHPYPTMVRTFQKVIGEEVKHFMKDHLGTLPDYLIAAVGGGSNAMGLFFPFLNDPSVKLIGVEAEGRGIETGEHAASITGGSVGILHGMKTYILQDGDGNITPAYSISAGLDYPGIGPEHAALHQSGRAVYESVTDQEALSAFLTLTKAEGIIPALESAHAIAMALKLAPTLDVNQVIVVNLSGRGDKDVQTIARYLGKEIEK